MRPTFWILPVRRNMQNDDRVTHSLNDDGPMMTPQGIVSDIHVDTNFLKSPSSVVDDTQQETSNPLSVSEKIINEMMGIIQKTHKDIETRLNAVRELSDNKTTSLSEQFQTLSKNASIQGDYLHELISIAQKVKVGDAETDIQDISALLHKTFLDSINCMLEVSKQAMLMVYILNDGAKNLNEIEKSIRQIEQINHKTKYLSINATIEAVRAGEAGESFQVVASEVRDLSNDTQRLAVNIRGQVNQMTDTLVYAQEILQKVASIDMSSNILAKEQLDEMMEGLIQNSGKIANIVGDASQSSKDFANAARQLMTDIQYQDRIRQDISNILEKIESMHTIQDALHLSRGDAPSVNALLHALPASVASQATILSKPDREPFAAGMNATSTQASDDIELF